MQNLNVLILGLIGYFGYILKEIPRKIVEILSIILRFSITVSSNNRDSYLAINDWVFSLNSSILKNNINTKQEYIDGGRTVTKYSINYGTYYLLKNKCLLIINKELMENKFEVTDKISISIYGSKKGKKQIKDEIISYINIESNYDKIRVYYLSDNWNFSYKVKRNFDDLFLKDKNKIKKHIDNWLDSENFYIEHGIPYKTGILLYGKPGTGKTTTAKVVASYLNFDLHIINLMSYESEQQLIRKISGIPRNSVVLLEDIDCSIPSRENLKNKNPKEENPKKEEKINSKALLGTIMNIIDGLLSPEGVIFIGTTNRYEKLDKALIRDGRFDLKLELVGMDYKEAVEMCSRFNISKEILNNVTFPINPAEFQNRLLHLKKEE